MAADLVRPAHFGDKTAFLNRTGNLLSRRLFCTIAKADPFSSRRSRGGIMSKSKTAEGQPPSEAALDPKALDAIGRALKAHYDDLVNAPLPQKFLDLLARLDVVEREAEANDARHASE